MLTALRNLERGDRQQLVPFLLLSLRWTLLARWQFSLLSRYRPLDSKELQVSCPLAVVSYSSPFDIATGAQVSPQKAEEIYRYLRYGFDVQMLPENLCAKGRSNAAAKS